MECSARTLTENTVWQGNITVEEDILIPAGITLTVKPGTAITVVPSDSTKTDPEYLSPLTEITVRGILRFLGTPSAPIFFKADKTEYSTEWAGIIIDGGSATLKHGTIEDANAAIQLFSGSLAADHIILTNNKYGVIVQSNETVASITNSTISKNDYGILNLRKSQVKLNNTLVAANAKKDIISLEDLPAYSLPPEPQQEKEISRSYEDMVLLGDTIWQGRIQINGLIRLPAKNRLIILPGTIIEFFKKDTNNDNIGENGLLLQGVLIAKGTENKPIIFRSAETEKSQADWDAINIINSDGAQNLIEHCRIENAYRGLHFHFANVSVKKSFFSHNYRGIQFQESAVEVADNIFFANKNAIQARDSEIVFTGNSIIDNLSGANFYRASIRIEKNLFQHNMTYGLKVREGFPVVTLNTMESNRYGLMLHDAKYGDINNNLLLNNIESGISFRDVDNIELTGNYIHSNNFSGLSINNSSAEINNNSFTENGIRGIGIREFFGKIEGNFFSNNKLYAIENEGITDVDAAGNSFDNQPVETIIFDKQDNPSQGRVITEPLAQSTPIFSWPFEMLESDLSWYGRIHIARPFLIPDKKTLHIMPGASIEIADQAEILVQGIINATGTPEKRILFTSASSPKKPEAWGEIRLEYADGSEFQFCDFEYGSWAVHCHFTNLVIYGCSFSNNYGGMRFRSGPVTISQSKFSNNIIGIRSFLGIAKIENNLITDNEKGIFVREKANGLSITANNIFLNHDYNVRIGEFNKEDLDARENWWGPTENPKDLFFDANREPGIGYVIYEPVLSKPVELEIFK
ncbi:MAG: right-handed parallel beta-helix repeat-containing protein [Proteobacteria bacterium]|nr:right-handed parallel beta-helix repeat-containing protein [Pseudomonadota bacterium]